MPDLAGLSHDPSLKIHALAAGSGLVTLCRKAIRSSEAPPHMNDGGSIIITSCIVGVKGDAGVCAYNYMR
jgi:hypothetical protein